MERTGESLSLQCIAATLMPTPDKGTPASHLTAGLPFSPALNFIILFHVAYEMVQEYANRTKEFRHASISVVKCEQPTMLVTATASYIPIEQFKLIFTEIGEWVEELGIQKLIFDKRQLTVFHQPSMEWYFVEWKDRMSDLGLNTHVKILPMDEVFRESVRIGRSNINDAYPDGRFHKMEIFYAESLDEAIAHRYSVR